MIIDHIENAKLYFCISERIHKALAYITQTDFSKLEPGKHEIDGDNIFAFVNDYKTKDPSECNFETHKKYIDVQYVAEGVEFMGYAPLNDQEIITPYNEENDITFYKGEKSFTKVSKGMFAIFFPNDVHMPGAKEDNPRSVRKVVVKVKVD